MKQAITDGHNALRNGAQTIVLLGPAGSGRSTFAHHLHQLRVGAGVFREQALELWEGTPETFFVGQHPRPPLLASAATILLEHAEFDEAGHYVAAARAAMDIREPATLCIVGTADPDTAQLWHLACDAPVIPLPPLEQRREDLLPLLHRWVSEAKSTGLSVRWTPGRSAVEFINAQRWPQHVRQLRRCIFDAFGNVSDLANVVPELAPTDIDPSLDDRERRFFGALLQAKARFEAYTQLTPTVPTTAAALRELARSRQNEIVAAVRLGVGIPQLRQALASERNHES